MQKKWKLPSCLHFKTMKRPKKTTISSGRVNFP